MMSNIVFPTQENEESRIIEEKLKEQSRNKNAVKVNNQKKSAFKKDIDRAYKRVEDEENYIVNLINGMQHYKLTNRSNWKFNLEYLKYYYDNLTKITRYTKNINMFYINSYIEAYELVLLDKNLPLEKAQSTSINSEDYNYSNTDAVKYAEKYCYNYNSSYPDWSFYGDCANFVSQCLYAGGKPWTGTPGTSEAAKNFANWFSTGTTLSINNVASTWRGADAFKYYWKSNALAYRTFDSYTSDTFDYATRGDAVTLLTSTGRGYHTLIIVGYEGNDLIYAAHTGDILTGSLASVSSSFIIYRMKYGVDNILTNNLNRWEGNNN